MIAGSPGPLAILDANVLFPFRKRDLLLRFSEAGLFRARWTDRILEEWTRNLLAWKPHLAASIQAQRQAMQTVFPEALVAGYEPLIETIDLPDADDRHVLAAAVRIGAQAVVTDNLADFPEGILRSYRIDAVAADDFLTLLFDRNPALAAATLARLRAVYDNPPFDRAGFIADLTAKGLPSLAGPRPTVP